MPFCSAPLSNILRRFAQRSLEGRTGCGQPDGAALRASRRPSGPPQDVEGGFSL